MNNEYGPLLCTCVDERRILDDDQSSLWYANIDAKTGVRTTIRLPASTEMLGLYDPDGSLDPLTAANLMCTKYCAADDVNYLLDCLIRALIDISGQYRRVFERRMAPLLNRMEQMHQQAGVRPSVAAQLKSAIQLVNARGNELPVFSFNGAKVTPTSGAHRV